MLVVAGTLWADQDGLLSKKDLKTARSNREYRPGPPALSSGTSRAFHDPKCVMIAGIGHDIGFIAVPEECPIRNIPEGLMLIFFSIPGIFGMFFMPCI